MISRIVFLVLIVSIDYLILNYFGEVNLRYFISLHSPLILISAKIFGLVAFIKKQTYLGLYVVVGLVLKMIIMLLIFIYAYKKLNMSNVEVLNFVTVYLIYTFYIMIFVIKSKKFSK